MIIVIIVVVVVVVLAAAATAFVQSRRRAALQQRFGPEYDRAVDEAPSRKDAEKHLFDVAYRRDKLDVRDLTEDERTRYTADWDAIQTRFVDEPGPAVDAAETLISTVMHERGYPVEDFEDRADLVAADHPDVVQHYREAHGAHERHRSAGGVDTEDLRQAFVHYRALFAALVDPTWGAEVSSGPASARTGAPAERDARARSDRDARVERDSETTDAPRVDAEAGRTGDDTGSTDDERSSYHQETR